MGTAGDRIHEGRIRRATLVLLLLLLIQFILGISNNLYVKIPAHHPGAQPADYFSGSARSVGWAFGHGAVVLAAHAGLGILLVLAAIGLVVQSVRLRRRSRTTLATIGALCVIGAGFNGASFLDFNKNLNSLLMALLFAAAMLCYLLVIYLEPGDSGG